MNIKARFEKVENAAYKYLESEIETICAARQITRRLIEKWNWTADEAVQKVSIRYPTVPRFLLTAKLTGRLQEAEIKHQNRIKNFYANIEPEQLVRELFDRLIKKGVLTREEAEAGIRRRFAGELPAEVLDSIFAG
jgi:hypothetical protein